MSTEHTPGPWHREATCSMSQRDWRILSAHLVTGVCESKGQVRFGSFMKTPRELRDRGWAWSHDRVTWQPFSTEEVAS